MSTEPRHKQAERYHAEAMNHLDQATLAGWDAEEEREHEELSRAFECERKAAMLFNEDLDAEPARSVLFRSAAALARDAGRYGEALNMISLGLSGNPPDAIRNELQTLVKNIITDLLSMHATESAQSPDRAVKNSSAAENSPAETVEKVPYVTPGPLYLRR